VDVPTRSTAASGAAPSPSAPRARGLRGSAWRWTLGLSGVLIAAYPFLPLAGRTAVYHVFGLLAVAGVIAGVRMHRLARPLPWLLLAAGQGAFSPSGPTSDRADSS
jgi:hypothetical protein